jgi:hypothetical protein
VVIQTRQSRATSGAGTAYPFTFPEHLSSHPVFSGVRATRSLFSCICFVDRCLSFCTFSFDHCVVFNQFGLRMDLFHIMISYNEKRFACFVLYEIMLKKLSLAVIFFHNLEALS